MCLNSGSRIERQVPHAKLNKVVRVECTDSTKVVGLQMPADTVEQIMQALSQRIPTNESTPKMELALRNLRLSTDAAATVVRLCEFLQTSSAAGVVVNICEQLTPAIVSAINAYPLPDELEDLITYMEGAFAALRDARTEKRLMKAELAQLLTQSVSGTKDDEGSDNNASGNPEPVAKVRAKILTKLQEATRQHAERQQRREAEKKRAQAGLDEDDDDDFAEVKQSPNNPRAAAAPSSSSKKARKSKKLLKPGAKDNVSGTARSAAAAGSRGGAVEKSTKTAAQMRLNRAAADKTQQRLGFSSLSAINKDKAAGPAAGPSKPTQHPSRLFSSTAPPCDAAAVSAPIQPTKGRLNVDMIEDDPAEEIKVTSDEEMERDHNGKRSRTDDAEDALFPQPQLKRVRMCLRSGEDPFLEYKNEHMELRTGQNLLSLSLDGSDSIQIAGDTQLPDPTKEFVAVYVSERHDAVLMSSTDIGPEVSVLSDKSSEPVYLHPHVPIILADGDTIELRGK